MHFEGIDSHGRTIDATAHVHDGLIFTGYTDHTVVWSLIEWDWDGLRLWGDNQEFCTVEKFRNIARGQFERPATAARRKGASPIEWRGIWQARSST